MSYSRSTILAATLALFAAHPAAAEDTSGDSWQQWRGPSRDGQIPATAWPQRLEGALTQQWRKPLGPSYSGPIAAEGLVFVTETKDAKQEVVRALDMASGEEKWSVEWEGSMKVPFFAARNGSWIRATPAYDDGRLYVAGMRDVLVCLEAASGKELWRIDFVKQLGTPVPSFGFVSSPLVLDNSVYVQAGGGFVKIDKQSGEIQWRTLQGDGGMLGRAFSSPVLATLLGKQQFVVQTRKALAGVDPQDGKVLWTKDIEAFRGMNILTPTISGDSIFTSSYGGASVLLGLDKGNGQVDIKENWKNRTQAYMSSPVLIEGHLYLHLRNRRFTCIDINSGETKWTTEPYGQYWSMVANGNRILALDQKGELLLIAANPEKFELVDLQKISEEETWAHLAVVGDQLLIRELKAMTVYQWK